MAGEIDNEAQIHLEAAEISKQIDKNLKALRKNQCNDAIKTQLAQAVRFFGKRIDKLQECNEAMLNLSRAFVLVPDTWSLRDSHAFLLMIASLLLRRKDEKLIRDICIIIMEFAEKLTTSQLKQLVQNHAKSTQMIFHKISKVSTYMTQMKLVAVLNKVLKSLDDGGAATIRKEKIIASCSSNAIRDTLEYFESLEQDNFLTTCREFLDFYNQSIIQARFIHSIKGFLMTFNGKVNSDIKQLYIDFNLRNLSISVFVVANQLRNDKSSQVYFIEMEDCEVDIVKGKFRDPEHLELTVKPLRSQILDEQDKSVDDLGLIESIQFVISEATDFFVSEIYPRYKAKAPMMVDNLTDNESMASFCTVNTFITNVQGKASDKDKLQVEIQNKASQNLGDDLESASADISKIIVEENPAPLVDIPKLIHTFAQKSSAPIGDVPKSIPKIEPKTTTRKTAKIMPTTKLPDIATRRAQNSTINKVAATRTNYDEVPSDNDKLPPANLFLAHRRIERQRKLQLSQNKENTESSGIPDYSEDITWIPNAKKPAAKKRAPPNKKPVIKKNAQGRLKETIYSTDEEDAEIEEVQTEISEQKKKPQVKKGKTAKAATKPFKTRSPEKVKPLQQSWEKSFENTNIPALSTKHRAGNDYIKPGMKPAIENVKAEIDMIGKGVNTRKRKASFKETALETRYPEKKKTFDQSPTTKKKKQYPKHDKSFDELFQDKTPEIPIVSKIAAAVKNNRLTSSTFTKPRAGDNPHGKDEKIGQTRKRKASFDNDSRYMKQRRSSSDESDTQQEAKSYKFRRPSCQESLVSFDLSKLKTNPLLGMFLSDQRNIDNQGQDVYVENSVQATNFTSTTYRSVQIQEIYSPPKDMTQIVPNRETNDDDLCRLFMTKANEVLDSLTQDFNRINETPVLVPSIENIITAIENYRESNGRFRTHVLEHIKLLKRLHHSKQQLMQYHEKDGENAALLKNSIRQTTLESRKSFEDKFKQLEGVYDSALNAARSIKIEIWQNYLQSISQNFNNLLKSHYDF